ncbi:hypothetical protein [Embleya sp. NPDC020630]|uniref:hypothetical protein n=1 Tax=Embleya sp. NPDC020630 TaxID=3363979 RepID=UPI00379B571A
MIVRTAHDVPELQAEMAQWAHDGTRHGAAAYFTGVFTAAGFTALPGDPEPAERPAAESMAHHLADTLDLAEAFYVTSDMTALAHHAARRLTDYAFTVEDMPAPAGVLVYQDPPPDRHHRPVQAITWGPRRGLTTVDYWVLPPRTPRNDEVSPDDPVVRRFTTLDPNTLPPGMDTPHGYAFASTTALRPGDRLDGDEGTHTLRLLAATWLLMGQSIATTDTLHAPRASRRRIARLAPRTPTSVRVIELRHARTPGDGTAENTPGTRAYQHRWVVRGHWRRYRDPRFSDEVRARPIWIGDHIAGPPGAPLIGGRRVHVLKR